MSTAIVWFNNTLRIEDHPALSEACKHHDLIIPVFIFDYQLLTNQYSSSNRNAFLKESLIDLDHQLHLIGGKLILKNGHPIDVLSSLSEQFKTSVIYTTTNYRQSYQKLYHQLIQKNLILKQFPGYYLSDNFDLIKTNQGQIYQIFTPFYKKLLQLPLRSISSTPTRCKVPSKISSIAINFLDQFINQKELSTQRIKGGSQLAHQRLINFLDNKIWNYIDNQNNLALDQTSRLSADLHFGTISPLVIVKQLGNSKNEVAWYRQLIWRDFYGYILYFFPTNLYRAFQTKYRSLSWQNNLSLFKAWQNSQTGYPIIDAAMKQLKNEGFIHNRARLITASFLTKDLNIDWRLGQQYFMKYLIDGDQSSNNGNWQWVSSVGVDPAPMIRRLYNPIKQQETYDPEGQYVKRYLPVLKNVDSRYLAQPWTMPTDQQIKANCMIGVDYPLPIINHQIARQITINRYKIK
jgi:deoxyribodipyrimidine photo-lyase